MTMVDVVWLERCAQLKVTDSFEEKFIRNLQLRYREHGMSMVITHKQRSQLATIAHRFEMTWCIKG